MTTETTERNTIALSALPAPGAEFEGGVFAGITTQLDGTHVAVILLPGQAEDLTWQAAMEWAKSQGGELPSRLAAASLFTHARKHLKPEWHWTCQTDEDDASYAWCCYFDNGLQYGDLKSYEGCAVPVRCIPISA